MVSARRTVERAPQAAVSMISAFIAIIDLHRAVDRSPVAMPASNPHRLQPAARGPVPRQR